MHPTMTLILPLVRMITKSIIWWGAEDGPSGIGPGSGDSIFVYNSNITFEPWLHHPAITKPSLPKPAYVHSGSCDIAR